MPKRPRRDHLERRSQTSSGSSRVIALPRPILERDRHLIALYSNCQLGMTPQQFYAKWRVTRQDMAIICSRSIDTVQRWFSRGGNYRRPTLNDLRHLALMDFMLEHFEKIPKPLLDLLCPPR